MLAQQCLKWGGWSVGEGGGAFLLRLLLCTYNVAVLVCPGGLLCYLNPFQGRGPTHGENPGLGILGDDLRERRSATVTPVCNKYFLGNSKKQIKHLVFVNNYFINKLNLDK